MRWTAAVLTALLMWTPCAFAAPPSLTAEQSEARQRALEVFKQGRTAYQAGDYDAALKFFRQAQAIYQHESLIILALAKTLDKAGDGERAQSYYRLFLKEAPAEDPDRAATVARIAELDATLAARPGVVVFANLPSAAEVTVNGKTAAIDHRGALSIGAGTYKVRVTMRNRLPFERTVVVSAGKELRLEVVLPEPVDPSTLPRDHTWTWVAGGLSAAGALTTGILALRGSTLRTDYAVLFDSNGRATETGRKRYDCPATAVEDSHCPKLIAEGLRLKNAILGNDTLTMTFGISTGALLVGTVVAWFAAPVRESAGTPSAVLTPSLGPGSAGVAWTLRF